MATELTFFFLTVASQVADEAAKCRLERYCFSYWNAFKCASPFDWPTYANLCSRSTHFDGTSRSTGIPNGTPDISFISCISIERLTYKDGQWQSPGSG